ncbi:hypothetical protein [Streptococcus gordonii]|uniref:hypothetical protein n=1 Tax=Streptococcus gordonii TaxID=1302 RepID=UPI001CBBA14F|nr:hypothetical protein [Streptococcus gordonii]
MKKYEMPPLRYYHCYSSTVSNVLDISELEILCNPKLLDLQINYETSALASALYTITDEFISNCCIGEKITNEQIFVKLASLKNGKYCLLTKTKNLVYCKAFQRHPDVLHFVTIVKKGEYFYIIDTFDGVDFYELVSIQDFDFTDSVLLLLSLKENNCIKKTELKEIINWYLENNKNNVYFKYIEYIRKAEITIDTLMSFTINGFLSSRLVFLYLLKKQKCITLEEYTSFMTLFVHKSEYLKLLLAKLQFRQCAEDINKMVVIFYELQDIENQMIIAFQKQFK